MQRQTQNSMLLIGVISGGVALTAFVVSLVAGDAGFNQAMFLAILLGLVVAVFLFWAFHSNAEGPRGPGNIQTRDMPTADDRSVTASQPKADPAPTVSAAASSDASASHTDSDHSQTHHEEPQPAAATHDATATSAAGGTPAGAADTADHTASADTTASGFTSMPADSASDTVGTEPERLSEPRGDGPDDLKRIKGVGPKLEALLHRLGFYHFDQIANWSESEVAWVDENLEGFKGRVQRDNWVDQAQKLSRGEETEFSQKVDKGDVY